MKIEEISTPESLTIGLYRAPELEHLYFYDSKGQSTRANRDYPDHAVQLYRATELDMTADSAKFYFDRGLVEPSQSLEVDFFIRDYEFKISMQLLNFAAGWRKTLDVRTNHLEGHIYVGADSLETPPTNQKFGYSGDSRRLSWQFN